MIYIKCKARPSRRDTRGIVAFQKTYPHLNIAPGLIIAPVRQGYSLGDNCYVVPFDIEGFASL